MKKFILNVLLFGYIAICFLVWFASIAFAFMQGIVPGLLALFLGGWLLGALLDHPYKILADLS